MTTVELSVPEPVLAVEINTEAEGEAPVLELETTKIEAVAGIEEEIEIGITEPELEKAILELGVGPDGRIELEGTPLGLDMPGVDATEEKTAATELELAKSELTEEL